MLSLRKLSYLILSGTIFIFFVSFYFFFNKQLHTTADVIVHDVKKDTASLVYSISKNLQQADDLYHFISEIKRLPASNPFVSAVQVFKDNKLMLTTDQRLRTQPDSRQTYIPEKMDSYDLLTQNKVLTNHLYYFSGLNKSFLTLYIYLDREAVSASIDKLFFQMIFWMLLLTIIYFILIFLIVKKVIINPAEILRQYAYYQSEIPKKMLLTDYEYIRSSMVHTFERLEKEKKALYRIARTDKLSGLPNREALHEKLDWLISVSERTNSEFALLFLDLDDFKTINDSLGHSIGDAYLKQVALVIKNIVRNNDIVARIGGDEFIIILNTYKNLLDLTQIIERIQSELKKPQIVDSHPIESSCSIGVAFYPKDGQDENTLMKQADIAMYQAKKNGKNQYHFFTSALYEAVQKEIKQAREIKSGIKNQEFELYYQPKVDLESEKIIACEALIRWNHPQDGLVAPNDFIPLAEKEGLIIELGNWIIEEAIRQQMVWKEQGICDIPIAVNISARQLFYEGFTQNIKQLIEQNNFEPPNLDIEITETLFIEDTSKSLNILTELCNQGLSISLDDFGTGYSSLSYLKRFPIHTLKIDKVFIDDFQTHTDSVFLETIVTMGKNLGITVLCEGVEEREQLKFLQKIGCDQYQGYYCSKPLSAKNFAGFISEYNTAN